MRHGPYNLLAGSACIFPQRSAWKSKPAAMPGLTIWKYGENIKIAVREQAVATHAQNFLHQLHQLPSQTAESQARQEAAQYERP